MSQSSSTKVATESVIECVELETGTIWMYLRLGAVMIKSEVHRINEFGVPTIGKSVYAAQLALLSESASTKSEPTVAQTAKSTESNYFLHFEPDGQFRLSTGFPL